MPQADVGRLLATAKYRYLDQTKRDVVNALQHYRNLTPKVEQYIFPDGNQRELLALDGTIPVSYRGAVYNIPICLYLSDNHPYTAPICYVRPTPDMTIKQSKHVDGSGRIYLPYLSDWKAATSDLLGAIQVMIIVFGETPPVYSKPRGAGADSGPSAAVPGVGAGGNPPYPTGGFQPMPRIGAAGSMPQPGGGGYPPPPAYPNQPSYPPPAYPPQSGYPPVSSTATTAYPAYPGYPTPTTGYPATSSYPPVTGANTSPTGTGTITEEHIRASLLSAVEDKVKQRLRENKAQYVAEIDVLKQTQNDLHKGKTKLDEIISRMENETVEIEDCKRQLTSKKQQLDEVISKCDTNGKQIEIDDAFGPMQPLYKQLLNAFAEENAIVDAIYYLGEALIKNTIELDLFLKHVRELSRRQFMLRELMQKCREKAGLPI